jgi:hypothetical protein
MDDMPLSSALELDKVILRLPAERTRGLDDEQSLLAERTPATRLIQARVASEASDTANAGT